MHKVDVLNLGGTIRVEDDCSCMFGWGKLRGPPSTRSTRGVLVTRCRHPQLSVIP